ncbi:retrovirus-related pol polyprotein from transposon TNT 1-94 [Tanacetum coccineum]
MGPPRIKPARIRSKEQCEDLINQVNLKSVEISDLNASLQEKVLVITALKDDLQKLKGKALVDNDVTKHPSDPKMLKIDVEPITPKLLNKMTAHYAYIKHTQEEAAVLKDLVDHIKANYPLDHTLDSACRKPSQSWGSIVSDVPSSSLDECMSSKLFSGSRGNNLYTLSLRDMMASSHICLLSKASKTKYWLWHKLPVRRIKIDNGTKFVNQTLREYYEKVSISHETSVARSPQQNGVIERRNRTLIEVARTMLIYAKAPLFLWAEEVAITCYTQNRSIVRLRYGKTPYELLHDKLPDLSFFHVFGALCYPTNDSENLGKLQSKADIDFNELTTMASEHSSSKLVLHEITPATISLGLVTNPLPSTPFAPPS